MKTIGFLNVIDSDLTGKYAEAISFWSKDLGLEDSPRLASLCGGFKRNSELREGGRWDDISAEAVKDAARIKKMGADFLLIGGTSMDKVADKVEKYAKIPVLSIAAPLIEKLKSDDADSALLIGAKALMEDSFFSDKFKSGGIKLAVPDEAGRGDLEKIRLAAADGRHYAYANFFEIALKYNMPYSIVACSKFDFILGSGKWLEQSRGRQHNSTSFISAVNHHTIAAVKMAAGIAKWRLAVHE